MKIDHERELINKGKFSKSEEWKDAKQQILESIEEVHWPPGSNQFVIRPVEEANGVSPITERFENNLDSKEGWKSTGRKHFKSVLEDRGMLDNVLDKLEEYYEDPEDIISSPWFDGAKSTTFNGEDRLIAVEWETGNISSSHRSLNRITLGLITGILTAGVVILPTRDMYQYLTDRVGNYPELEPYFLIWELLESEVENGIIEVIAVEHDQTGDVPPVGKMTDGMADREVSDLKDSEEGEYDSQSGLTDY